MNAHVFQAEGTLRHHIYVTILLIVFGYSPLAAAYWINYFLFYWDEFKVEFLDYDEFTEECLEMFNIDLNDHLKVAYAWDKTISDYYGQPGQSRPSTLRMQAAAYDRHSDFQEGRWMNVWDHPDVDNLTFLMEFFQDDWDFLTETDDLDPTANQSIKDLTDYYLYFDEFRKIDGVEEISNKYMLRQRDTVFHPLFKGAGANQLFSIHRVTMGHNHSSEDSYAEFNDWIRSPLADDFRLFYWKGQKKAKAVKRGPKKK